MKNIETVKAIIKKKDINSFLLLKIKNRDIWQFVTGKVEGAENSGEALRREIEEEIGLKSEIININKMDFIDIFSEDDYRIISTIFLVEVGDVEIDIHNNPDGIEHEDFEWLSKNEVLKRLEFENQRRFFGKIIDYLE